MKDAQPSHRLSHVFVHDSYRNLNSKIDVYLNVERCDNSFGMILVGIFAFADSEPGEIEY